MAPQVAPLLPQGMDLQQDSEIIIRPNNNASEEKNGPMPAPEDILGGPNINDFDEKADPMLAPVFTCTIEDCRMLSNIFKPFGEMVEYIFIHSDSSGMKASATDSHLACSVCMYVGSEAFSAWNCDSSFNFCVDFDMLMNILHLVKTRTSLEMRHTSGENEICFFFTVLDGTYTAASLQLLEMEEGDNEIPMSDYVTSIKMPSKTLLTLSSILNSISDDVMITVSNDFLTFSVSESSIHGNVQYRKSDTISFDTDEETSVHFLSRYLRIITLGTGVSDFVQIQMNNEGPIMMTYARNASVFLRFSVAASVL